MVETLTHICLLRMTKELSNDMPSNGGDACPCHLTAATHARAVVAAAAGRILAAVAAHGHVLAAGRILAAAGHVLAAAAGRARAAASAAATATSLHADTAGIHILGSIGVTGVIVALAHFYIQTGDFLYAESGCGRTFKVATQARHSKEENRRLFVYRP